MTSKRIAQPNQQQKSEKPQASGILQRFAVRSVAEAEVQSTDENEALALSNSAFSKDFSRVPISTTTPAQMMAKQMLSPVVQQKNTPATVQSGEGEAIQRQEMPEVSRDYIAVSVVQQENKTGLPDKLKAGIEKLSGISMDDVKVHYNSDKPAQLQALAYTQGTDIHVGPRQEQHLRHEAWHVVQQKQGRVHPIGQVPDGRRLNDEPALEAEADSMGEQAAQTETTEGMPPLQRVALDEDAPIQGVFRQTREVVPVKSSPKAPFQRIKIQKVQWINLDNKKVYIQVGTGPGHTIVPYIWVSPIGDPSVKVAIRHGISSLSREQYNTGNHRNNEHFDDDWYEINEDERQQLDHAAQQSISDPITDETEDEVMEDFTITPGKFEQGSSQLLMPEIEQQALAKIAPLADLITGFTAQVVVLPTAKGELSEGKSLGFQEQLYTPDQVWVQNIFISNERLNTRFGVKQESHTVAFTLSRNTTIRLAGRTAQELILHFLESFEHLKPLMGNDSGKILLQSVLVDDILRQLTFAKMPIDRWQALLSNLIRIFFQVYQLSTAATFKGGKPKTHGEQFARDRLDEDEKNALQNLPTRNDQKMADDAETMIDVKQTKSLGVPQYAFAVNHWLDSLKVMYPTLMAKKGDKIIEPFMNQQLGKDFKKFVKTEQNQAKDPVQVNTVKDLLEYYNYAPGDIKNAQPDRPQLRVGGFTLPDIPLGILNTDFTASIAVTPLKQGVQQNISVGFGEENPTTFPVELYKASQVEIHNVTLGDKERPKTKFIQSQKSHTVAWTLVRHQMMGYKGRTLQQLLAFLDKNLLRLQSDIKDGLRVGQTDGLRVAQESLDTIKVHIDKFLPIHEWQALISALVPLYLVAYSVAESASYVHPKEVDRPQGHGEPHKMRILRLAEYCLSSGETMINTGAEVIAAAVGLMDAYIVDENPTLSPEAAVNAYHHWEKAMSDAFPTVMQQAGDPIRAAMLEHQVSAKETFGSLILKIQTS